MTDTWDADVVVVGAGSGGLTAAAYLSGLGKRVIVVDRHHVAGGNATVFEHKGYQFDVGVHFLADCGPEGSIPSILRGVHADRGIRFLEMGQDNVATFVFDDGQVVGVPKGHEAARSRLVETFPSERDGVDAYFRFASKTSEGLAALNSIKGPFDAPGKLWSARTLIRNWNVTLGRHFDQLDLSPRLRSIIAGPGVMYALGPSKASALANAIVFHTCLSGGSYPEGGGQVISDALAETIVANGGEIILRTPVEKIIVEGGSARGVRIRPPSPVRARGVPEEIRAPVVLSNADLKRTFLELVGEEHVPKRFARRIRNYTMALPFFVLYLILDQDISSFGLTSCDYLVFADDDLDRDFDLVTRGVTPDRPYAYLTMTSLRDPANTRLCRPGQANIQVMSFCPPQPQYWGLKDGPAEGERYRRNPAYRARKDEWCDKMLAAAEKVIPDIREHVVYQEAATPMTHERFVRSTGGTSYGIEMTPRQLLRRPKSATPIPGLYLCGASTRAGGGIGGTMVGGVMAASAIAGADLMLRAKEGEVFVRSAGPELDITRGPTAKGPVRT